MGLSLTILESATSFVEAGFPTRFARGLRFGSNRHGFARLECELPMRRALAYRLYDRGGMPHVVVGWMGAAVWEGRLEDVAVIDGGLRMSAYGYWRALSDVLYTAQWSYTRTDRFVNVTPQDLANRATEMYQTDFNRRVWIALMKGNTYGNTVDVGAVVYKTPDGGARQLKAISFSYDVTMPNNWKVYCKVCSSAFGSFTTLWTLNTTGVNQTGTQSISFSGTPGDFIVFEVENNTGGNYTMAGETGTMFARITSLRIKSTTSASVCADELATALATYVNGINASQLQASAALINSPGVDLKDVVYEDESPADILEALVKLGDSATPPNAWETGVFADRLLHLRQRGSAGQTWYVDVAKPNIERTLDALANSAYANYQDADGRGLRSAAASDADSIARWAVTRHANVRAETTSSTQAGVYRDAALADKKTPMPRADVQLGPRDFVFDASGVAMPKFLVKSGDTVTIRNLPPTLSSAIDRVRTFRVEEAEYEVDTRRLIVVPEAPLPSLDVLLAQRQ